MRPYKFLFVCLLVALAPAAIAKKPTLKSITVTPPKPSLLVGATQQFDATARYSNGSTKNVTSVAIWTSSSHAAVTISAEGLATAVEIGKATIEARVGTTSGKAQITVEPRLESISVASSRSSINIGKTEQFTATAKYSNGSEKNVSGSATWTSSQVVTAIVSKTGLSKAKSSGVTRISATLAGVSGSSPLFVPVPIDPVSNITLYGNGSDPHLLTNTLSDGTTADYYGPKDTTGAAAGVTSIIFTHRDRSSEVATFDSMGRSTQFFASSRGTILLSWISSTEVSATAISPDGTTRLGPKLVSFTESQENPNRFTPLVKQLRGRQSKSREEDSSSPVTTVDVTRCSGRPVQNATVLMGITASDMKTAIVPSSGQSEPGVYTFDLPQPNTTPGLTVDQVCAGFQTAEKALCFVNDEAVPAVVEALTALAGATGILLPEGIFLEILSESFESLLISGTCTSLDLPSQNPDLTAFEYECRQEGNLIDTYNSVPETLTPFANLLEGGSFTSLSQIVDPQNPSTSFSIDAGDTGDCEIESVGVTPNTANLGVGSTLQLTAKAYDGGFAPVPSAVFNWDSNNGGVATADNTGEVSGVSQGQATITATEQTSGKKGSSTVSVTGNTYTYTYTGKPYGAPPNCTNLCELWDAIISPTTCPLTGSFTMAQPLPPNLSTAYITPTSFTFTFCSGTITNLNAIYDSEVGTPSFTVSTDTEGQISDWLIEIGAKIEIPVEAVIWSDSLHSYSTISFTSTGVGVFSGCESLCDTAIGYGDEVTFAGGSIGGNGDENLVRGTWTSNSVPAHTNITDTSSIMNGVVTGQLTAPSGTRPER